MIPEDNDIYKDQEEQHQNDSYDRYVTRGQKVVQGHSLLLSCLTRAKVIRVVCRCAAFLQQTRKIF